MGHRENKDELSRLIDAARSDIEVIRLKTYNMVGRNRMPQFSPKFDEIERMLVDVRTVLESDLPELPVSEEDIVARVKEKPWEEVCRDFMREHRVITAVRVCRHANPSWTLVECKNFVESLK
jgi:hypothetical protein